MKMLEDLTKRVESGEKMIEANDKKVETYNSRVDQISGAPPILKGVDSKKFVQKLFPTNAAPKPIPKKFRMPDLLKYNGTPDPNEHVTSYTCTVKGNDLKDGEIESVLLKKSRVVEQLRLLDQIMPTSRVLNGFNMVSETTKGEITLPFNVDVTTQNAKFHVIEGDMRYNILLRRPWLYFMRAVPSTLYQMMKFLTKDGIKIVYGEHQATREMFAVHDVAPASTPSTSKKPQDKQTVK
uniref:Uncharacterized protein n=1 Tax=Nicotiana tabacum TaxID=4097 RepID=A0A1S3ZF64_TOBAC|nr:PREDICTED: uncharacterized protein LOC107786064 [Nicotiana tabacum]